MELPLRVALVALGFPLFCVGCGWCLLGLVPELDREERFAAAGGVGAAFLAAAAFVAFLTGWPPLLIDGGFLLLFVAVVLFARLRLPPQTAAAPSPLWPLAGLCALGYLHLVCIQALLPQYVGGMWLGDWQHHYLGARVFAGLEPVETEWGGAGTYTVASRTPLFNLAAAAVMELAGPDFCIFQTAVTFLSACFLPTVYLLLRDLFGPWAARLGLLLAPLNLWLLHISWFTWPKMLAASYLLLALHFYVRSIRARLVAPDGSRRLFLYCWVSGLLGYMTHQVAAVYLLVLVAHAAILAFREHRFRLTWSLFAVPILTAAALLGPWYTWLVYYFGVGGTTASTPTTQMDPAFAEAHGPAKVTYLLGSVGYNLLAAVFPFTIVITCWEGPRAWGDFYERATDFYFNQLTGALTLSLGLYLLARAAWSLRRVGFRTVRAALARPEWSAVWAFALLGGVGAAALHPLRSLNGVAHSAIFPTTVLLVVLAWGALSQAPRPLRALVCAGMVAEFLAMFWSHVFLLDPLLFDAYNPQIKAEGHLVFLNDCLGPAAFAGVGVVQGVLVVLLVRHLVLRLGANSP